MRAVLVGNLQAVAVAAAVRATAICPAQAALVAQV
jgi:hypothetical protein